MGFVDTFKTYLRTGHFVRERLQESSWQVLAPSYAITNERAYVTEGYRRNSAVRRCCDILANSLAMPYPRAQAVSPGRGCPRS